jgi:protocatechuate 3,4-dioxygenase beta subunit
MTRRRDVLLSIGAVLGVANLSLMALARRQHGVWREGDGGMDAPVDGLEASSGLRCTPGTLSLDQMEGPFYTPNAPHRRDIREFGVTEQALVLRGHVRDSECRPLAGAILDFWQTGHDGTYDQHGYRYRGYQYTDSEGRFELVTFRPRAYTAMSAFRTAHIHVKVQGRNTALLNTQLYIPDAAETNARDNMYMPALEIAYGPGGGSEQLANFDFVLPSA